MEKIVLFGELLLRLKSPGKERLLQSPALEAVFGGSEANVAVSLAVLGREACFVTALPEHAVGRAAAASLARYGVRVQPVLKPGRLGIYFLEDGACQRPSTVIYDRSGSCFAETAADEYGWASAFSGASWFHVSGVTPAVSQNAAGCALCAMKEARRQGASVSLDLNYRKKLWKYGASAVETMRALAALADVIVANEEDIQNCLGIAPGGLGMTADGCRHLCEEVRRQFPNVRTVAVTLRRSQSADRNGWSAVLSGRTGFFESASYSIENIVERVGAGDSFAAGLIFGLSEFGGDEQKALDFAAAASCLKHSIPGDFNLSTKEEILALMAGNANGRIQR